MKEKGEGKKERCGKWGSIFCLPCCHPIYPAAAEMGRDLGYPCSNCLALRCVEDRAGENISKERAWQKVYRCREREREGLANPKKYMPYYPTLLSLLSLSLSFSFSFSPILSHYLPFSHSFSLSLSLSLSRSLAHLGPRTQHTFDQLGAYIGRADSIGHGTAHSRPVRKGWERQRKRDRGRGEEGGWVRWREGAKGKIE